jgi:hypothetical protein
LSKAQRRWDRSNREFIRIGPVWWPLGRHLDVRSGVHFIKFGCENAESCDKWQVVLESRGALLKPFG